MTQILILILNVVGGVVYISWTLSGVTLFYAAQFGREPTSIVRNVYHEFRPFYWAAVLAITLPDILGHGMFVWLLNWVHYLYTLGYITNWYSLKDLDDDDDRWKRRRRKVAEAVKTAGSKLVVVPTPAGA